MIEYQVGAWLLLAGSGHPFNEAAIRRMAAADLERTPDPRTAFNHATLATLEGSGHEIHETDWARILNAIEQHTIR